MEFKMKLTYCNLFSSKMSHIQKNGIMVIKNVLHITKQNNNNIIITHNKFVQLQIRKPPHRKYLLTKLAYKILYTCIKS